MPCALALFKFFQLKPMSIWRRCQPVVDARLSNRSMISRLFLPLLFCALVSGCAGVLHGNLQSVHIQPVCHEQSVPAACTAQNARGVWHFQAPATIEVHKDYSHLKIACKSPFFKEVAVTVPSMLNLSTAGNLLVGGLVGTGVDVYSGSAFAYAPLVRIQYPACER